jgi:flagellar protein FliO/FliZ
MDSPELFSSLLKIVSALAVTVGVMIMIAYLFKKIMNRGRGSVSGEWMRILSSQYLAPKSSIMLVDVLGRIMVISISNGTVSLLTEIMDPEALEHLKDVRAQRDRGTSFSHYLKGYLKRSRLGS